MKLMTETVNLTKSEAVGKLVDLAQEVEIVDPIDWGMLSIKERDAYELMANSVIDQMHACPENHKETVMMATMTKLLVENFVLNLKLRDKKFMDGEQNEQSK
tara:strand:- start:199 stop:504 length:306 start_codon:yes stop_codon:yes gene_type:complete